eukprot:UN04059
MIADEVSPVLYCAKDIYWFVEDWTKMVYCQTIAHLSNLIKFN